MTGSWPGGLYSSGMHDFVLREAEVGTRVALAEDEDACMGADFRLYLAELTADRDGSDVAFQGDTDEEGDAWC